MTIHPPMAPGDTVQWLADDYAEQLGDGSIGRVRQGDTGIFVAADGADSSGAVVEFPIVGAFVCKWSDIEQVPSPATNDR